MQKHIVCIASEFKGNEFFEEAHAAGWQVTVVTKKKLLDAAWAWTSINDVRTVDDDALEMDYVRAVTNIAGTRSIERVVGMDEFDVMTAATAREHLNLPGMSRSQALRFRDKLTMRDIAFKAGIPCPQFVGAFNVEAISEFLDTVPAPWIVKPRHEVSAFGIRKCETVDEVWDVLKDLDRRNSWRDHPSQFLIERFIEGRVFHVDSVVENGKVRAAGVSQYGTTPFKVSHYGGVFTSSIVPYRSAERNALEGMNVELLSAFNYDRGVSHAEFLQSDADGKFYLLEVACRVGGAYIANVLEHACGFNLWREWARLETADEKKSYKPPKLRKEFAGITLALANTDEPDTSGYADEEIVYKVNKSKHVGLIFHSKKRQRIDELISVYTERITADFLAVACRLRSGMMINSQSTAPSVLDHQLNQYFPELLKFESTPEMEASEIYSRIKDDVDRIMNAVVSGPPPETYRGSTDIRALAWNLERGIQFDGIADALATHPDLKDRDILMLPELDYGMARSGNRFVAKELANRLRMGYAFAPIYIPLQKGSGVESDMEGENTVSIHGLATLSPHPMANVHAVALPNGKDKMWGKEKRLGWLRALVVDVEHPAGTFRAVTVHLDVHCSREHRRRQMRIILDHLETLPDLPTVIGGDWNTTTFNAQTSNRAILGYWRRVMMGIKNVAKNHFPHPDRYFERGLFADLENHGFEYKDLNEEGVGTLHYHVESIEKNTNLRDWVPEWCFKFIFWAAGRVGGSVSVRLDWFAAKGLKLAAGSRPRTIGNLINENGDPLSDHDAITVELIVA